MDKESDLREDIERSFDWIELTPVMLYFQSSILDLEALLDVDTATGCSEKYWALLHAHTITILETYLSDSFIGFVNEFDSIKGKLINETTFFTDKKKKYTVREIYQFDDFITETVDDFLNSLVWHKIGTVQGLYRDVLGVNFPDELVFLHEAIDTRHDIVHRNGQNKAGEELHLLKIDVAKLMKSVEDLVIDINEQLRDKVRLLRSKA
jgi:hypothetical protein